METRPWTDDLTAVRQAVEGLLEGALDPMLALLAEEVVIEVATGDETSGRKAESGKQAVGDYFTALGGLMAFWQMDYTATGDQVIAWGKESFTIEHCEIEGGCEFALVFDLCDATITRLLVIEDLPAYMRRAGPRVGSPAAAAVRQALASESPPSTAGTVPRYSCHRGRAPALIL